MRDLMDIIKEKAENLSDCKNFQYSKVALLAAIATLESSMGKNNKPRFEKAYYKGGKIYNNSIKLQKLVSKYGKDASSSWGCWQIMYVNAIDAGYIGAPSGLTDPEVCIDYVIRFINMRILHFNPDDIGDIFDAYNSGSFRDGFVPHKYVSDGIEAYNKFLKEV